ncbi:MAG TPA: sensor histidine kinase [Steroidobacteraceae bacterium]|nr:sensor histidine kinase [Steroidobacteraceae bacterium]
MSTVLQRLTHAPQVLSGLSPALLVAASIGFIGLVGVADFLTGFNLSFSAFYLLGIGFAAWFVGKRFALLMAAVSIVISALGDWAAGAHYSTVLVPVWNGLILTMVYALTIWLLGHLREAQRELEHKVEQRTGALTREIAERERLEKEILEISEREQRRIGHDLHDGLCQHLTATAMAAQVAAQRLAAQSQPESAEVAELVRLIEAGISMTRDIAHGIAPLEMESAGLVTALRALAENVSRVSEVACCVDCDSPPPLVDGGTATHLYRIAQEAVNNALRHGKPRQIVLSLNRARHRAALTIEDDGTGLPEEWQSLRGLGTRIMAHRASLIGGVLTIEPNPTGGTLVTCAFPAPQEQGLSHADDGASGATGAAAALEDPSWGVARNKASAPC